MRTSPAGFAMSELSNIVERCNPDFDAARAISWRMAEETWAEWLQSLFEPIMLPHLWRVLNLAERQSAREIILLDVNLNRCLKPLARESSVNAGRRLLQRRTPRSERLMARIQEAIQAGDAFGHFATLYAVRCSAFSIPARTAILGYLMQELAIGAPEESARVRLLEASVETVNEFLRISSNGLNEGLRVHG
jgi:urease accessory protein UreF